MLDYRREPGIYAAKMNELRAKSHLPLIFKMNAKIQSFLMCALPSEPQAIQHHISGCAQGIHGQVGAPTQAVREDGNWLKLNHTLLQQL